MTIMTMAITDFILYCIFVFGFNLAFPGHIVHHRFIIKQNMAISNHHRHITVYAQNRIKCGIICGQDSQCGGAIMNTTRLICSLHNYTGSILHPLILEQSQGVCSLLKADIEFREVPQGYDFHGALQFWFKVVVFPQRFPVDAKAACYNDGAFLILIDSQACFTFVKNIMGKIKRTQYGLSRIYFQGYRESDSDPWVDDENNPLTFFDWEPTGAGTGNFIRINTDFLMEASEGGSERSFICQLFA